LENRKVRTIWFQRTAIAKVVVLGLLARKYINVFPDGIAKYPGSALWATAVFFAVGLVTLVALAIATLVEFSQLINIIWLNEIRRTSIGHLFLGSTFNAPDSIAYAFGIGIGCLIETLYLRRKVTP
jgi:Protein of unknown function (DUF2809)